MAISHFEDIRAWQKGRELTRAIYRITAKGTFARDFGLRDQIRRASVSIVSNIAEGFERDGDREFIQFLSHAKGSGGEVRAQLYVALDAGHINQQEFDTLSGLTNDVTRQISAFMKYLSDSAYRGRKWGEGG